MASKKIIILKSQFHKLGGLEKYALHTAKIFAKKGFDVHVLTSGKKPSISSLDNIEFHYFDHGFGPNFMRIDQFDRYCQYWLKKFNCPFILGMDRTSFQTHIRAGNGSHIAYLKRRHSFEGHLKKMSFSVNPLHRKILDIEKTAFESPYLKKLITNSHMVREEILSHYNIHPNKVVVIHNGVEFYQMENAFSSWMEEKENIAKTYNMDLSNYHFLFIGNGFKRKGLKQILLGLSLLKEKNFTLSVIGYDKNMREYLRLAKKLNLSKNVFFFGMRQDCKQFLQLADCLIIPSFYDPFANVTLEALSMGLFVITSKHNGAKEIITPDNGTVIEDLLDRYSMKEALERAMNYPKTFENANVIRKSVEHLDFSNQLSKLVTTITS